MPSLHHQWSYAERIAFARNPQARRLLRLIEDKQTNLALAADVTTAEALLQLTRQVAPYICVLKTHIDILQDFTPELLTALQQLQAEYDFLIFEDRKFADIGNTVRQQYGGGVYRIADWADISNAHLIPGPGIIQGLRDVGLPLQRGLLLLAQMSSQGNLADQAYRDLAAEWADEYADFVCGWIAQQRISADPGMLVFTPGIHLQQQGDALQQAYRTPQQALAHGSDVLIVGRGIYQANDPAAAAITYRDVAWQQYLQHRQTAIV